MAANDPEREGFPQTVRRKWRIAGGRSESGPSCWRPWVASAAMPGSGPATRHARSRTERPCGKRRSASQAGPICSDRRTIAFPLRRTWARLAKRRATAEMAAARGHRLRRAGRPGPAVGAVSPTRGRRDRGVFGCRLRTHAVVVSLSDGLRMPLSLQRRAVQHAGDRPRPRLRLGCRG